MVSDRKHATFMVNGLPSQASVITSHMPSECIVSLISQLHVYTNNSVILNLIRFINVKVHMKMTHLKH